MCFPWWQYRQHALIAGTFIFRVPFSACIILIVIVFDRWAWPHFGNNRIRKFYPKEGRLRKDSVMSEIHLHSAFNEQNLFPSCTQALSVENAFSGRQLMGCIPVLLSKITANQWIRKWERRHTRELLECIYFIVTCAMRRRACLAAINISSVSGLEILLSFGSASEPACMVFSLGRHTPFTWWLFRYTGSLLLKFILKEWFYRLSTSSGHFCFWQIMQGRIRHSDVILCTHKLSTGSPKYHFYFLGWTSH